MVLLSKWLLPEIKSDVLNSLLLIQLYADNSAEKFGQSIKWGTYQREAQSNTQWMRISTKTLKNDISGEAEVTVRGLVIDGFTKAQKDQTLIAVDAVAIALSAVMSDPVIKKDFIKAILRVKPVHSPQVSECTSNVIVQVCVVEAKARSLWVDLNMLVGVGLDEQLFVQPIKGVGVVGTVEITHSRFEMNTTEYGFVRKDVLEMIKKLNAGRKEKLKIVDVCIPEPVIAGPVLPVGE